ncbi:MAG: META domain-containing protein [Sporichthyaceae bacterium]
MSMRGFRLAALGASVVGAAVAVVAGAGPSESAGSFVAESRPAPTAPSIEPLEDTSWRLVAVTQHARTTRAPHSGELTLRVSEGRFTLRTCNLMLGQAVQSADRLVLRSEWSASRRCTGIGGRLDSALHEAAREPFRIHQEPGALRLTSMATGTVLRFRVVESPRPPLHAVQIGELDGARGNCRVLAARTERGPRLYVLARTRPGGPWRLLPGGPATPDDGAVRTRALDSLTPGSASSCVTGFGPQGPYVKASRPAVGS